jgi:hypothetical protein
MNVDMLASDDQNGQTTRTGRFLGSMVNAYIVAGLSHTEIPKVCNEVPDKVFH